MPPPDARIWAGAGMPAVDHQVEPVAQPERHALEHGPRQVPPVVADRQPDERAARQRVGVRAALAGEVGQEQQAVAARRGTSRGRRRPASPNSTPGASASRNQRRLPAADSITDIMCQRPGTAWQNAWTRPAGLDAAARRVAANTTPDVPSDSATTPGVDGPDPDRVRGLVAAAGHDRRPGTQPGRGGGRRGDRARDLGPFERRRHPRAGRSAARRAPPATSRAPRGRTGSCPAPSALSIAWSPVSRSRT